VFTGVSFAVHRGYTICVLPPRVTSPRSTSGVCRGGECVTASGELGNVEGREEQIIGDGEFTLDAQSGLANALFPEVRAQFLKLRNEVDALLRVYVDDVDALLLEPIHSALRILRVAHDNAAEAELIDEPAAIPAGRQSGDENGVVPGGASARRAEGVGLTVERAVALLHEPVASLADQLAIEGEDCSADRHAAFVKTDARLFERNCKHFFGSHSPRLTRNLLTAGSAALRLGKTPDQTS
jgi:hypothetical protein